MKNKQKILSNVFGFKGNESKEDIDKKFMELIKEYSFPEEIGLRNDNRSNK